MLHSLTLGMPDDAKPQNPKRGRLSYTITSPFTKARVEVLLKGRAFRIVKMGVGPDGNSVTS